MQSLNISTYIGKKDQDSVSHEEWNGVFGQILDKVNELVSAANSSTGGTTGGTTVDTSGIISVNNKGNVTLGNNDIKNVNIEPGYPYSKDSTKYGDIAFKPGDDIQFASHHREPKKRDKIVVKNIDGSDNPVKLQVVAGEMELAVGTTKNPKTATKKKDKTTGNDTTESMFKTDNAKVMDIKVLTGNTLGVGTDDERDERAYLKVRAQAIDLRCEKHGGIALQPKGYDSDGNMNKIKFEHGGGDGLEFGTFNTEKTSIFTDEYRFNKDGIWKMSTRETVASGKNIIDEKENGLGNLTATAALKYKKNNSTNQKVGYEPADDFYDFINIEDEQCTTKDIIKTAYALNGTNNVKTHITSKGNLEIETTNSSVAILESNTSVPDGIQQTGSTPEISIENADYNKYYNNNGSYEKIIAKESPNINIETDSSIKLETINRCVWDIIPITENNFNEYTIFGGLKKDTDPEIKYVDGNIYAMSNNENDKKANVNISQFVDGYKYVKCRQLSLTGGINITSDEKVKISGKKVTIEGFQGFEPSMTFGETEEGIKFQYKATKKGKNKQCDIIQVEVFNNSTEPITFNKSTHKASNSDLLGAIEANSDVPTFCNTGNITIPAKSSVVVAQASMYDIIMLVNYMKTNNQGPWAV